MHNTNKKYDKNGKLASSGNLSQRLLILLSKDNFRATKLNSTGREQFGKDTVDMMLAFAKEFNLNNADLFATAIEFSCISICQKVKPYLKKDKKIEKLYLTGGGRKNIFLVERLKQLLPDTEIRMIDELSVPGDFVEAVSYAVLAESTMHQKPIHNRKDKNGLAPLVGNIILPPVKS